MEFAPGAPPKKFSGYGPAPNAKSRTETTYSTSFAEQPMDAQVTRHTTHDTQYKAHGTSNGKAALYRILKTQLDENTADTTAN